VSHLSYVEAVVVGAFQGISELFPVSSLGHSILIPALVGGSWARISRLAEGVAIGGGDPARFVALCGRPATESG